MAKPAVTRPRSGSWLALTLLAASTYSVAVSNIPTAIDYTVQIVDCP